MLDALKLCQYKSFIFKKYGMDSVRFVYYGALTQTLAK